VLSFIHAFKTEVSVLKDVQDVLAKKKPTKTNTHQKTPQNQQKRKTKTKKKKY